MELGAVPGAPLVAPSYAFTFPPVYHPLPPSADVQTVIGAGNVVGDVHSPRSDEPAPSDSDDGATSDAARPRKSHACGMCHKAFDRPSTLRIHQRVHTLAKEFQCNVCSRRFSVSSNLKRHEKKCSGAAGQGAPARAAEEPKLKRPRRKNTEPRWVPDSLKGFVLGATAKLSMPLPAAPESYANMNLDLEPYRDGYWTGRLPGPALKPVFRIDKRSYL